MKSNDVSELCNVAIKPSYPVTEPASNKMSETASEKSNNRPQSSVRTATMDTLSLNLMIVMSVPTGKPVAVDVPSNNNIEAVDVNGPAVGFQVDTGRRRGRRRQN